MAKEKAKVDASALYDDKPKNGGSETLGALATALESSGSKVEKSDPEPQVASGSASAFDSVIVGKVFEPPKILGYGIDGVGKSTFASQAPKPIVIQTEEGNNQIGTPRFPVCLTYQNLVERLALVANGDHQFQTLVLDGASGAEKLIYEKVARDNGKANIDLVGGGFDKGQKLSMTEWEEVKGLLDRAWARGMAIVVLAHARSEKIGDPENPMAEQYAPALHKKTSGEMFRRWADATLFFTRRMTTRKEGQGFNEKTVAVPIGPEGGERIIRTAWTPASVAKNRYEMPLEIPFPKNGSWGLVMAYIAAFYEKKGN